MPETLSLLRSTVTNKFGVAGRRVCFSRALSENCPKTRYKQSVYKSMKRDTGRYLINDVTKPIIQKKSHLCNTN